MTNTNSLLQFWLGIPWVCSGHDVLHWCARHAESYTPSTYLCPGGIAARAALSRRAGDGACLVMCVASPYGMPPLALLPSAGMLNRRMQQRGTKDPPYLSISAGIHDFQVPTAAAAPPAAVRLSDVCVLPVPSRSLPLCFKQDDSAHAGQSCRWRRSSHGNIRLWHCMVPP